MRNILILQNFNVIYQDKNVIKLKLNSKNIWLNISNEHKLFKISKVINITQEKMNLKELPRLLLIKCQIY